ncbi:MAG: carboxy terminal-processing peptidase [Bacteroidota bacterium]
MRLRTSILALVFMFFFGCLGSQENSDEKNAILLRILVQGLQQAHFEPKEIDNDFSKSVFELYLKKVDVNKLFLTKKDYEKLKSYQYLIDDQVNGGTFQFLDLSYEILSNRISQVKTFYNEALADPFDFKENESMEFDFEKIPYAEDEEALKDRWRKFSKYYTLSRLYDLNVTSSDLSNEKKKNSFKENEAVAREKVKENFDDWFSRLEKLEKRDRLSDYLNAITGVFDPHTVYYAPKAKQDFDIEFSGKLEGIGARLQEKDGYITVESIVPGSASWRQGDLETGDRILKVAQDGEEPVDIVGMRIDDAVQLIRGKKDTKVILNVMKIDGLIQDIPIVRDIVIFEQTYAKSALIEEGDDRVGYIKLPSFYADFNASEGEGRRCAVDVRKEIIKLKGEGAESLILDLRNNGGGSLADVVEMAGLFIEQGPVVQVKSRGAAPLVLEDEDPTVYYDGPLIILVNSFSASASEIMAAAMQDYGRAVIIGSGNHTFGKGTVQRQINFDDVLRGYNEIKPFGSIFLTTQKFYRIDGSTNQLKGVKPDIALPDRYTFIDYGEKDLDYPIPWDEIRPADFNKSELSPEEIAAVKELSMSRVESNPKFQLVYENAENLKVQRDKTEYTLNYNDYKAERERLKKENEKFKALSEEIEGIEVFSLEVDRMEEEKDSVKLERAERLHRALKRDIYVDEALKVLDNLEET